MKKAVAILGLAFMTLAPLASCSEEGGESSSSLAAAGSVDQKGLQVFPTSELGSAGDPMPFYDEATQTFHIFHLVNENPRLGTGEHPIVDITTKDFLSYAENGKSINYSDDTENQDFMIGTGSCVKAPDGTYHFFYTGHNGTHSANVVYSEKIQHATSTDLKTWTKVPEDGFYGAQNDFRDPQVVWMEDDNCWWMLVTTQRDGGPVIAKYTSTDLKTWKDEGVWYKFETANMECPTLLHVGDYWYLTYSPQYRDGSQTRVTKYRYRKDLNSGDWIVPEDDGILDWAGFYAGKLVYDGNKLYVVGWTGDRSNDMDNGALLWGGKLAVHELTQNADGTLTPSIVTAVDDALATQVAHPELRSGTIAGSQYAVYDYTEGDNATKLTFKMTVSDKVSGVSFGVKDNTFQGLASLSVSTEGVNFYPAGFSELAKTDPTLIDSRKIDAGEYDCTLIVQDETFIFQMDDRVLTGRCYTTDSGDLGLFGQTSDAAFYE